MTERWKADLDRYLTREPPDAGEPEIEGDELEQVYRDLQAAQDRIAVLVKALTACSNMVAAVAGDIEDGYSLTDLRGKYVMALINARDDARSALSPAQTEETR